MKLAKFAISFIITLVFTIALSLQFGQVPPLGKFLDPFNGFLQNAEGKQLYYDPVLQLEDLHQNVTVLYDSLLFPHVFAADDHDLYFAQGYITASHRLWQMEFLTHAAAGRVSEIVGERAINFDKMQRREGMVYGAENMLKAIKSNDTTRAIVQSYTDGVNAYINSLSYAALPIEYKLLNYEPEPWTPLKTTLLFMNMKDDLSGHDVDLENTNMVQILGKERYDFLYPDRISGTEPVIPTVKSWDFKPLVIDTPKVALQPGFIIKEVTVRPGGEPRAMEKPDSDNGSNNWAVSGKKTRSGRPILSNDPHLGLNLPSIWFVMQLHAPGVNVMGGTLPGMPGVVIGFNDSIAWGLTNATRDVRDWYKIEFTDRDRLEYYYDNKRLKTQIAVEEIKVRYANPVYDTIVFTHYGPVVYDRNYSGNDQMQAKQNFALQWMAHEPSQELLSIYKINRARNYQEYVNALTYFSSPAQNVAFASASGDIALWIQGKFPAKWKEQGKFLMDGSQSAFDWQAYIPQSQNAHILNPERGFVSSANQYPVDSTYPYYVYDDSYEHYRNRRINAQLGDMNNITPQDMMRLQNDTYNLKAAESLPLMLDSLDLGELDAQQKDIYDMLRNWDYRNDLDKTAPTVYDVWWDQLYQMIWDEFTLNDRVVDYPSVANTLWMMKNHPEDTCFDMVSTTARESLSEVLQLSFKETVQTLEQWKEENGKEYTWGTYKGTFIRHLLQLEPFSKYDLQVPGGEHIVSANKENHGQSWKMVVELGNPVRAWGIYPGGQSGNPGSYYYDNMIDDWASGKHYPLVYMYTIDDRRNAFLFSQSLQP